MMNKEKKIRKCPHCKSNKGFSISFRIQGMHNMDVSFKGEILNSERSTHDDIESYGACLNCGRSLPIENLKIEKI